MLNSLFKKTNKKPPTCYVMNCVWLFPNSVQKLSLSLGATGSCRKEQWACRRCADRRLREPSGTVTWVIASACISTHPGFSLLLGLQLISSRTTEWATGVLVSDGLTKDWKNKQRTHQSTECLTSNWHSRSQWDPKQHWWWLLRWIWIIWAAGSGLYRTGPLSDRVKRRANKGILLFIKRAANSRQRASSFSECLRSM